MSERPRREQSARRPGRERRRWLIVVGVALAIAPGCATYSDRMEKAQVAATAGDYEAAIAEVDRVVGVDLPSQLPNSFDSDTALAVLERASLKQATGEYSSSARDFQAADKELDLLDLAGDTVGEIGKYTFSDSSTKYASSPTEKLALNGFNMLNYLAEGDLQGARVEARRFTVMQNYLNEYDPGNDHVAFGSYLAGFTLEQLGEHTGAMRYYDEALAGGPIESLRGPVARLAGLTSYRGKHIGTFLGDGASPAAAGGSELLVIVSLGRVPFKVPERMPVGAAVGVAGTWISGDPAVLGYTATKVVVFPRLEPSPSVYSGATVTVNGSPASLELVSSLGAEITREYEAIKPQIIGAAISRMIVRAAVAEGARAAGNQESETLGWILALFTEAAMVAADKPDTRSWIFMPDRVYVHRSRVAPGEHEVAIALGSEGPVVRSVEVPKGGFAAVVVTAPR